MKGKCRDLTCSLKADKVTLICHTKQTKQDEKQNKRKNDEQLSLTKIR